MSCTILNRDSQTCKLTDAKGRLSWGKEREVGQRYKVKWLHCVSVYWVMSWPSF